MAITSVLSSYFIKFNHQLYLIFDRVMNRLGLKQKDAGAEEEGHEKSHSIVVLGFHRGAKSLIEVISNRNPRLLKEILVIDFNPEVLKDLKKIGIDGVFGDISSVDTLDHTHIQNAKVVLSTIPDMLLKATDNMKIVKTCRTLAPQATIVATADSSEQAEKLKKAGANEVLLPYTMAGEFLANFLDSNPNLYKG
jgi:Trk K+ transport system NAD-binding subunit